MFYSHSIENDKLDLFTSFVQSLIEGQSKYESVVDYVISETHALATGSKNLYSIDRDSYPIIVLLDEKEHDFFKRLETSGDKKAIYQKVLNVLSDQKPVSYYQWM